MIKSAQAMTAELEDYGSTSGTVERLDWVNGSLRVLVAGVTLLYPLLDGPNHSKFGDQVQTSVLSFIVYSVVLYATLWRPLLSRSKKQYFYVIVAIADLMFTVHIMSVTGGAASPFFRALYVWVAMLAFFLGMRGGGLASVVAMLVLSVFLMRADVPLGLWESTVKLGGLLMHGPLIGALVDVNRRRTSALDLSRRANEEANLQLQKEQSHTLRLQKLTSLGLIAAGVAHEVNNPLQGALGAVQALRGGKLSPERESAYLEVVETALTRMKGTVVTLLDYSRKGPLLPSAVAVTTAIEDALSLLSSMFKSARVLVENRVRDASLVVMADKSRLQQALTNVLLNALHAAGEEGTVTLTTQRKRGCIGVVVADDGPGISTEDMDKVCDPFYTTKPVGVGTGLGLAITLRILRDHGGDLEIESSIGEGTTVTLWLPGDEESESC